MSDVHKIAEITITTKSTEPLIGIVQVNTGDTVVKFEITEDLAHMICTNLSHPVTAQDPAGTSMFEQDNGREN
jgi:hypothetical protein